MITALYDESDEKETKTADLSIECPLSGESTEQTSSETPKPEEEAQETPQEAADITGNAVNAAANMKNMRIALIIIGELAIAVVFIAVLARLYKSRT